MSTESVIRIDERVDMVAACDAVAMRDCAESVASLESDVNGL